MKGLSFWFFFNLVPLFYCFKIPSNDTGIPSNTSALPSNDTRATECQINIRNMPLRTPLIMSPTTRDIIYPDIGRSIITIAQGQTLELDCPGNGNLQAGGVTTSNLTVATCVSEGNFLILGNVVDISTVVCSARITSTARYTGNTCWRIGREIEVGLQIQDGRFLRTMTACFDDTLRHVLYSQYYLTKQIGTQITGGTSPTWAEDNFYNLGARVNNIYPKVAHRATINRQLGLPDEDLKYVHDTGHYYIAKGHLTARTDFMYNAQQMSTFHYINSAPQWQTFNGYNWFYFERNLRNYAFNNFLDLEVYTGTYGISTLPHEITGLDVELYFFIDNNGNRAMPIPELFWKVAYDPLNKAGIAVLGINNPYQTDISKSILCTDIADDLTWLTFDRFKLESGYIYACTIDDFRRVVPDIPRFDVQTILN